MAKLMEQIPGYNLKKRLEVGNYAIIYEARDKRNRDLIIKISRDNTKEFNELIRREFQILAKFKHPNIVRVNDYGMTRQGRAFFTLEHVKGKPINRCFREFTQEFIQAIIQVLSGIGAFHNKNLIHCDLKSEHLIYDAEQKKCVIIDFGFAGISTSRIKEYGTIGYIAPEVLKGVGIDQRSDLYSLGVIIYEVLSGTKPVKPYKEISDIPDEINSIIRMLLSDEPSVRPAVPFLYEIFIRYLPQKLIEIPYYQVQLPITSFVKNPEFIKNLLNLRAGTVVVTGDMGSGKTRLLKELKYEFLFRDYEVFFFTGEAPFHTSLLNFIGCPDLDFSQKEDRYQVYAEITEQVLQYGRDKNFVIMVDDLDNLSDYDLGLFRYLGHSLQETSISLIGAGKPDPRIKDLNLFELFLNPFSKNEIKELIEKTFFQFHIKGDKDLDSFVSWLYRHSGGNPLFITEILKTLYNQGALYYIVNRWEIDTEKLEKIVVPEKIEEILSNRLKGLNQREIEILKVFALTDCLLELDTIQNIISSPAEVELEILKILSLIREEHIGKKRFFSLSNKILKMLLEQRAEKREILKLMEKTVEVIEQMAPLHKHYYPVIAQLCERLNDKEKAFRYFVLSAREAELSRDYNSALEFYNRVVERGGDFEPAHYPEFLLNIAELYFKIGNYQQAIEYYRSVIERTEGAVKIKALSGIGRVYSTTGEHKLARQYLQDTQNSIKNKKSRDYLETINRLAYSMIQLKDFDGAERLLNESSLLAEEIKDYESAAEVMYYSASLAWSRGEIEKGKEICNDVIVHCEKHKLNKQLAYAANLLSSFYIQTGDIDAGLRSIEKAIIGFEELKNTDALVNALINKGLLLMYKEHLDIVIDIYEDALLKALRTDNRSSHASIFMYLASLYEESGRFKKAIEYYTKCLEIQPDSVYANYNIAMVYLKMGDFERAEEVLEQKIKKEENILYGAGMGILYSFMGQKQRAKQAIDYALVQLEKEKLDQLTMTETYLNASLIFYQNTDYENAIHYAERVKDIKYKSYFELSIADAIIHLSRLKSNQTAMIDLSAVLNGLKEKGYIYYYALLKRMYIDAAIDVDIALDQLSNMTKEIEMLEDLVSSINAKIELQKIQELKLRVYPVVIERLLKRGASSRYLEIFSGLAEIIHKHLGDENFAEHILDFAIQATGAERGAIFLKVDDKMELIAGRNVDRKTIKDAGELSKTAIEEIKKNKIVFVPNALEDPRFNLKKSVVLNQIRSILCIPLITGDSVIGAIYLDSKMLGSIFGEQDRDFLLTTARFLASVIEKSRAYRRVVQELIQVRNGIVMEIGKGYLIGKSRQMKKVYGFVEDIAHSHSPVLITGETGTGKGMLARLIHMKSKRKNNTFLSINCGAIPETLLESELFGHKKGAFTGAFTDKKGLLEEAEGGTVFLDEITNTSPAFQVKILEAIEDKVIRRVGETTQRKIDVRFILASNKDVEIEVEEGRFREDLYYRINTFHIRLPSLRERINDIPQLALFFLEKIKTELNKKDIKGFAPGVIEKLKEHYWEGNVRELQNTIDRAATLAKGDLITLADIGFEKRKGEITSLREIKKEAIVEALNTAHGNKKKAAQILGISRRSLYNYLKKFNIDF
ncbi:MAG: sigma 54-interacting transcriptional regulator [bacterium]